MDIYDISRGFQAREGQHVFPLDKASTPLYFCELWNGRGTTRDTDDKNITRAFFGYPLHGRRLGRRRFCQGVAESGLADMLDQVSIAVNSAAQLMIEGIPQVRIIDAYSLTAVSLHRREMHRILYLS